MPVASKVESYDPLTVPDESPGLSGARMLQGRRFSVEVQGDDGWSPGGTLALDRAGATLDGEALLNLHFHPPTNTVRYSYNKGGAHRAGVFSFTDDQLAFVGTVVDQQGTDWLVRGAVSSLLFHTRRKAAGGAGEAQAWDALKIENAWVDEAGATPVLETTYTLGDKDVSNRTAVTHVDHASGTTKIEMVTGVDPLGRSNDSFEITLAFDASSFAGTYTQSVGGDVYDWTGTATDDSLAALLSKRAEPEDAAAPLAAIEGGYHPSMMSNALREASESGPSLTTQDLNAITAIWSVDSTDKDGNETTKTLDVAQAKAGELFNYTLVNAVEPKWLTDIFGKSYTLPASAQKVADDHKKFCADHSVLAVGQILYQNFSNDEVHKEAMKKVDPKKLDEGWKALGKETEYGELTQALYVEGYRIAVTGMAPYLADDPQNWAREYYSFLTRPRQLALWQTQLASNEFKNVKTQMYEWFVKLTVLDDGLYAFKDGKIDAVNGDQAHKATLGHQMLSVAYSALLATQYTKVRWSEDIAPILLHVIEDALHGDTSKIPADILAQDQENIRKALQDMVTMFDTATGLADNLILMLRKWSANNADVPMVEAGDILGEEMEALFAKEKPEWEVRWGAFKGIAGKVCGLLLCGAGAAFLIYQIVQNSKGDISAKMIVADIALGLVAVSLLVKGAESLMALGVGDWLRRVGQNNVGFMGEAAQSIAEWFSEAGVAPTGRLGNAFVTMFGKNSAEFFAKRLGPAMAVLNLVLAGLWLADAIKSGVVSDIVLQSLTAAFALGEAVFIGIEIFAGCAWAGPFVWVFAALGLIVALIALIWSLISPPKPPPSPIDLFVQGPMVKSGFATA